MIDQAVEVLAGKERILVFTGAGISTESGIPDFRGPQGIWKEFDPADYTYDHYVDDPEFERSRGESDSTPPTSAHPRTTPTTPSLASGSRAA